MRQVFKESLAKVGIAERQFKVGPKVAETVTRIVMLALEAESEERLCLAKQVQSIRELDFSVYVGLCLCDDVPNGGFQQIAAENAKPGRRAGKRGFLDQSGYANRFV